MFRLARLQRKLERSDQEHYRKERELIAKNTPEEELQQWAVDQFMRRAALTTDIQRAKTSQLLKTADRLGLPIPPYDDHESWDTTSSKFNGFLTAKAQTQLRQAIRQEKKERREIWTTLIKDIITPIGGIIISILSLMIAYAALKLKH
jgi:hypothetical protein